MTTHITGTRDEWRAARRQLLDAEKEHTRRGDELARQRQELPWVRIDKAYSFDTDEGKASLADLFRAGYVVCESVPGAHVLAASPSRC